MHVGDMLHPRHVYDELGGRLDVLIPKAMNRHLNEPTKKMLHNYVQ